MHPTHTSSRYQQQRIVNYQPQCDSYQFFNVLTSDELLGTVEDLLPEHRERLYPPTETLSMFLAQGMSADRSCQAVVNQAAVQRLAGGLSSNSTFTGGYCKARQRLPQEMVSTLTREVGRLIDSRIPDHWRWNNRPVRIVDGTTLTMPDTAANQAAFPQQRGQKPGLGFPICRVVGITCYSSGVLLNAAVGRFNGKGGDEQTLLRSIQDTLEAGDILLGDAFFSTYFFMAAMLEKGVDLVMEQQGARRRSTDFRRGQKLGQKDHVIILMKPKILPHWMTKDQYEQAPASIQIRELKVNQKILVTTLVCVKTYPKEALKALYKSRWDVELDIRNIKQTLGMDMLSCKTPEMAVKEIWVYLLAYNVIRLLMAQSALLADLLPRTLSFKHCLQLWSSLLQKSVLITDKQLEGLFNLMSQQIVGNRPGRIEPRAVKRRSKPFPLLVKPRAESRAQVRKYGHPRKLK